MSIVDLSCLSLDVLKERTDTSVFERKVSMSALQLLLSAAFLSNRLSQHEARRLLSTAKTTAVPCRLRNGENRQRDYEKPPERTN
jgi:hypothetical protein